jgi:hypothetical protein
MLQAGPPRQGLCRTCFKQPLDRAPLGPYLFQPQLWRSRPGDDHQIDPLGQQVRGQPEALPAQPLDAVTLHCAADRARHHQTQARRAGRGRLLRHQEREMGRADAAPGPLGPYELEVLAQPAGAAHATARLNAAVYFL